MFVSSSVSGKIEACRPADFLKTKSFMEDLKKCVLLNIFDGAFL